MLEGLRIGTPHKFQNWNNKVQYAGRKVSLDQDCGRKVWLIKPQGMTGPTTKFDLDLLLLGLTSPTLRDAMFDIAALVSVFYSIFYRFVLMHGAL